MQYGSQLSEISSLGLPSGIEDLLEKRGGDSEFGKRIFWELKRGKDLEAAWQSARLAEVTKGGEGDQLAHLSALINRGSVRLLPKAHTELGKIKVLNFSDQELYVFANELEELSNQFLKENSLVIVIEDSSESLELKKPEPNQLVVTVPLNYPFEEVGRELLKAVEVEPGLQDNWVFENQDRNFWSQEKADEHHLRLNRYRDSLGDILSSYAYGLQPSELYRLEDPDLETVTGVIEELLDLYLQEPRMTLACKDLLSLSPLDKWQEDPEFTRSLLNCLTGDNSYLSGVLAKEKHIRLGSLVLTGDPDKQDDDLLSATLPGMPCALVLRPEVLNRTIALAGYPHPQAFLAIPHALEGRYSTVALREHLTNFLKSRLYYELYPAASEDLAAGFQGKSPRPLIEDDTTNLAFQALMHGIANAKHETGVSRKSLEKSFRVAVGRGLYQVMSQGGINHSLGGAVLGELSLEDVEQIVISLSSIEEFRRYQLERSFPGYLMPARKFFEKHDINLRIRPPSSSRGGEGAYRIL